MSSTVRMRFTRSYQIWRAGQEYDFQLGLARSLELTRLAVRVDVPEVLTAVVPQPAVERAESPVAKAARKRRRNV